MDSEEATAPEAQAAEPQPPLTSELYHSVIMRPVDFPFCFAALTNIYNTIDTNGLDVNTTANAIGCFLNNPDCNYLYIAGLSGSHADGFFADLRNALDEEPEICFHDSLDTLAGSPHPKHIVRLYDLNPQVPTKRQEHRILRFFLNTEYDHFSPDEFSSYIFCGNGENGPIERYECKDPNNMLCVRTRFSNMRACGICFWIPIKGKLEDPILMDFIDEAPEYECDEAAVAHPLGVPPNVFKDFLSDTDYDFSSADTYNSDCEW